MANIKELLWLGEEIFNEDLPDHLAHLINEDQFDKYAITPEERAKVDGIHILGIMEGCYFVPGGFSGNGRFYPAECWTGPDGALSDPFVINKLSSVTFFGTLGHEDKEIDETDVFEGKNGINTYKLWIDPITGLGMGRSYILNNKSGWGLFCAMKSGSKFKMSTRAKGNFKDNAFKTDAKGTKQPVVDPKSFKLLSVDVVFNPGFKQTSAVLKENQIIKMNGSDQVMTDKASTLNNDEALELKQEKYKISESAETVVKNFSKTDWDLLMTSKLKRLGESKVISHKKNGYHYDAAFIPVELPLITEARLKQEVSGTKIFETSPVEVDIISKAENNEFGTNGIVLCWQAGNRPANITEALSKFVKKASLFETDSKNSDSDTLDEEETDTDSDTLDEDSIDSDDSEDKMSEKTKRLKEKQKLKEARLKKESDSKAACSDSDTLDEDSDTEVTKTISEKKLKEAIRKIVKEETDSDTDESKTVSEKKLKEAVRKIVKEETDSDTDETKSVSERKLKEAVRKIVKEETDTNSSSDSSELSEFRKISEGKSPAEFQAQLNLTVGILENLKNTIFESGFMTESNISLSEKLDLLISEHQSYRALASISDVAKYKALYEDVAYELGEDSDSDSDISDTAVSELQEAKKIYKVIKEKYGSLPNIKVELKEAKRIYKTIKEKYGSLNKIDEALHASKSKILSLEEQLKTGKPSKEIMENEAQRIANELEGKMSIDEVFKVLNDYKGNLNEAENHVFKFMRSTIVAPGTKKPATSKSMNESLDPIGTRAKNKFNVRGGSTLGGYYDSLESTSFKPKQS